MVSIRITPNTETMNTSGFPLKRILGTSRKRLIKNRMVRGIRISSWLAMLFQRGLLLSSLNKIGVSIRTSHTKVIKAISENNIFLFLDFIADYLHLMAVLNANVFNKEVLWQQKPYFFGGSWFPGLGGRAAFSSSRYFVNCSFVRTLLILSSLVFSIGPMTDLSSGPCRSF